MKIFFDPILGKLRRDDLKEAIATIAPITSNIANLENNEYKITYYEIVSGANGSLAVPTNAAINSNEFGSSGNCVLSKVDGSNKPTLQSPKTAGGVVVTASLNVLTGAWVASGAYTDTSVALIYSIKIKAMHYGNLTYNNIVGDPEDIGIISEYYRGDRTFQTLNTSVVTEGTNLYLTGPRIDSQISTYTGDISLTGSVFSIGAGKVTNTMLAALIDPSYGGTGINNGTSTIDLSNPVSGHILTSDASGNANWQPVSASASSLQDVVNIDPSVDMNAIPIAFYNGGTINAMQIAWTIKNAGAPAPVYNVKAGLDFGEGYISFDPDSNPGHHSIMLHALNGLTVSNNSRTLNLFNVDRINDIVSVNGTLNIVSPNGNNSVLLSDITAQLNYYHASGAGYVNIDNSLNSIFHTVQIDITSPNITVSQNPTLPLGVATKSYVDASGVGVYEPIITSGSSTQYWRGDKTFQTLNTSVVPDSTNKRYVTDANLITIGNTSGINSGDNATNNQYSGLAAGKEDAINKVTTFTGNETSITKFPVVKAILDYFTATNIKSILGITNLSGSNTGDETTATIKTKLGVASTSTEGYLLSLDWNTFNNKQPAGTYATGTGTANGTNTGDNATNTQYSGLVSNATHTGDATGSTVLTLATVNSNVGTFGGAASVNTITVNGKGLVTGIGSQSIQIAESQVTNLVSDLGGKADKLNTVLSSYLEVPEQTTPTTPTNSIRLYTDASNRLSWVGENGFTRTFDGTANTANRMYTLQDKSGTIAHLDDITGSSNLPLTDAISQLNTPPAHVAGERYLINTTPTGAWVGFANNIAESNGTTWTFTSPILNNTVYLTSVAQTFKYNGSIWSQGGAVPLLQNGNTLGQILSVGTNDAFNVNIKRGGILKAQVTSTGFAIRNTANTFNAELQSAATSNVTLALPLVTSTIVGQSLAGVVNRAPYYDANGLLTSSAQLAYLQSTGGFSNIFSQNGITNFNCANTSAGAASSTQYSCANGTYNFLIKMHGSGFAANGLVKPHLALLQTNGTGGLLISSTVANTDILFTNGGQTSADETFRISTGGLTNTKAAATAGLHLKAGTSAAGGASSKYNNGTRLATAESGANEFENNFYNTNPSLVRYGLGGTIFDYIADSTVGGVEADVYSTTLIANTFLVNKDKITATYSGNFVTVGTEMTQLKVIFAGTTLWDSTVVAPSTGTTSWRVVTEIIRVSSTVIRYTVTLNTTGASGYVYCKAGELTGLTLSNSNILKITGASSGVGSGTGNIIGKMGFVEFKAAS